MAPSSLLKLVRRHLGWLLPASLFLLLPVLALLALLPLLLNHH